MQSTFVSNGRQIRLDATIPTTPGLHPAILILHGSGGNTSFWLDRIAPFIGRLNIALFAIHYFDATGDTQAVPSQFADGVHIPLWLQAARDGLAHIASNPAIDPTRIALIGVSLGAFMSLTLGTESGRNSHPKLRCIVDISGGLIPPWDAHATSAFPPTLILHGDSDTVVPVANALNLAALLTRLNVPHKLQTLPHEGHWFSPAATLRLVGAIAPFLGRYLHP